MPLHATTTIFAKILVDFPSTLAKTPFTSLSLEIKSKTGLFTKTLTPNLIAD